MKSTVGHWTDSRMKSFVTSALRGAFGRFPNKFEALKNAAAGKFINKKTGREAMHYTCAKCASLFPAKDVAVDHKRPVVDPKTGFVDWDTYISRMFCRTSNLQVLCKECHKVKTAKERKGRNATALSTVRKGNASGMGQSGRSVAGNPPIKRSKSSPS